MRSVPAWRSHSRLSSSLPHHNDLHHVGRRAVEVGLPDPGEPLDTVIEGDGHMDIHSSGSELRSCLGQMGGCISMLGSKCLS